MGHVRFQGLDMDIAELRRVCIVVMNYVLYITLVYDIFLKLGIVLKLTYNSK